MNVLCQEARMPPAVRAQRALRLATEELGCGSLQDILSLASELVKFTIYPDFALDFFRYEYQDFQITESKSGIKIKVLSRN